MTAAQLLGLMYSYTAKDKIENVLDLAYAEYESRFGEAPTIAAVHPGTVIPQIIEIEIVTRKFIRPGFILVGKLEKEGEK